MPDTNVSLQDIVGNPPPKKVQVVSQILGDKPMPCHKSRSKEQRKTRKGMAKRMGQSEFVDVASRLMALPGPLGAKFRKASEAVGWRMGVESAARRWKNLPHVQRLSVLIEAAQAMSSDAEKEHEFSCVMAKLPGEMQFAIRQLSGQIPCDDLAEDGREDNPHVTVKFGLHTDKVDDVQRAVLGESPIACQLGKCSTFTAPDHDVVKIEIESGGLHELHERLSAALANTETHPTYQPHVTIAYVKSGLGEHYAKTLNNMEGKVFAFDRIVFSDKRRKHTTIPLIGKAVRFSLPIRMAAANPWILYRGPRGGKGWKHSGTGDIRYGGDRPGAQETGGDDKAETPSRLHPAVERHVGSKPREEMTQAQFSSGLQDLLRNPEKYGLDDDAADRLEQAVIAADTFVRGKKADKNVKAWWAGLKPHQKLDAIDEIWSQGHADPDGYKQALMRHYQESTGAAEETPEEAAPKEEPKPVEKPGETVSEPAAGPDRVEVRGDIYIKSPHGWTNESNPAYNASDEMMQRWRDRGLVKEAKGKSDGGKPDSGIVLETESGGSGTGRLPAGEQLGADAGAVSAGKPAESGQATGDEGGVSGVSDGTRVGSDSVSGATGGRGDAAIDGARTSVGESLPGTELEQPDTADVQAALSKPPTPKTPTDLSAGNWKYHTRDFASGGLKTKFRNNIAALKVMEAMKVEGRTHATPEEQVVLSKWVGWGQFPAVFNEQTYYKRPAYSGYSYKPPEFDAREELQREIDPDYKPDDWESERIELKSLLSESEWQDAKRSTLNAHFTHPDIVDAHWAMAKRLGYTGGRFLETSAGIGYYLGQMPAEMAARTHTAAVELESRTGEMLKALYPKTHVAVEGFQDFRAPNNFYDLVASNVPFAKEGPYDPRYAKYKASLHDYFFLKSADVCKPGGLIMHITSTGTMDKADPVIRQKLMEQCDLVAAYRMPGDTHKENAGTSVVTDMVILRKRLPGEKPVDETETPPEAEPKKPGFTGVTTDSLGRLYHWKDGVRVPGPRWDDVVQVDDPDGGEPIPINRYFAEHPEAVLGRLDRSGTMYSGEEKGVSLNTPEDLSERLGRKVRVDVDPENKKRRFVFDDTGEPVPRKDLREHGEAAFKERLQKAIESLPEGVFHPEQGSKAAFQPDVMPAPGDVLDGGFTIKDGKLYQRQGGGLIEQKATKDNIDRIEGMLGIRDAARSIINKERSDQDPVDERKVLNERYDAYVEKYGFLNDRKNSRPMIADPDSFLLRALEKWDAKENTATKADMFSKRTVGGDISITKADNVADGLGACLHEFGRVNIEHIAELTGQPVADVGFELVDKGLAFEDPQEGWKPADQYLSGNVRRKLIQAQAAAAVDPKYQSNVEALLKVQPEDVDYSEITPNMGAPWIPPQDIQAFGKELLNANGNPIEVMYTPETGEWQVRWSKDGKKLYSGRPQAKEVWGTERADIVECFKSALTGKSITVKGGVDRYTDEQGVEHEFFAENEDGEPIVNKSATADANAKVQEIRERFKEWLWEDEERTERLARYYNDNFNNIRDISYNGQHLTFPGMNPDAAANTHPHIKDFVWQVVTTGRGLAAHEVGLGKTRAMIAAAMELRRLGLAKKPCIACLKSNIEQITKEVIDTYPGAKILSTSGLYTAKQRQEAIARMATGDYDIVLMTHDQMNRLKMSPEIEAKYIREELAEREAAKSAAEAEAESEAKSGFGRRKAKDNRRVKALEKAKLKLEARLKEALSVEKKDRAMAFDDLGVDQLFVDEFHAFKSLPCYTKQDRIKGIPTNRSQRATTMLMRARWLQEQNGGRGLVVATGTPISNTMAELYNMQRYLQYDELKERGIHHFDAWCSTFGEIQTKPEFTVAGEYKPATRLSAFSNIPELMHLSRSFMDVVRADDVKRLNPATGEMEPVIKRPNRKDESVVSRVDSMPALMSDLVRRAKAVSERRGPPEKGSDNMLVICTDGRKGAVDMRLLDDNAPDDPNSKTNLCVNNVLKLSKERPDQAQIIFCDLGVHAAAASKHSGVDFGERVGPEEADADEEQDDLQTVENGEDFTQANLGANGKFRLYDDIIDKLVKGGIPREQIADFSKLTGEDKIKAMAMMRNGEIKVAIGSTQKLGTGTNVQNRLMAMHHLDVPWVPASVEQRDGRGWRHGNTNKEVGIYRYVAEGSLDQKFWDIISTKAKFQDQVLHNRESNIRTVKDDDTEVLTPEQLMAIASGDTRQMDRVNLEEEVKTLSAAEKRHEREQKRIKGSIEKLQSEVPAMEEASKAYERDVTHLKSKPDFEYVTPEIPGVEDDEEYVYGVGWQTKPGTPAVPSVTHTKRKDGEEALTANIEAATKKYQDIAKERGTHYLYDFKPIPLGEYRGFKVFYDPRNTKAGISIEGKSGKRYDAGASVGSIDYVLRDIARRKAEHDKFLEAGQKQLETAKSAIGKKFGKAEELKKKTKQLDDLLGELGLKKKDKAKAGKPPTPKPSPPPTPPPPPVPPAPINLPPPTTSPKTGPRTVVLTGNTYNNKDAIKALGARWNPDRKAWVLKTSGTRHDSDLDRLQKAGVRVSDESISMSLVYTDPVAGYDDDLTGIFDRLLHLPGEKGDRLRMAAEGIGWRLQGGGKRAERWQQMPAVKRLSLLVEAAQAMGPVIRMSGGTNPWVVYRGPRGGKGWKHSGTGDVRYGGDRPGADETGSIGEETPSPFHPSAARHLADQPRESMTQEQFGFVLQQLLEAPEDNGLSEEDADRLEEAVVAVQGHVKKTPAVKQWWHGLKPHEKLDVIGDLMAGGHRGEAAFKAAFVKHHGEATGEKETSKPSESQKVTRATEGTEHDKHIGRSWESADGKRTVTGVRMVGGQPRLSVATEGRPDSIQELIRPDELEGQISRDTKSGQKHRESAETKAKQEQSDAARASERDDIDGFAEGAAPITKQRIRDALNRQVKRGNSLVSRKSLIRQLVANGAKIGTSQKFGEILQSPDGTFVASNALGKTGIEYAKHLMAKSKPAAEDPKPAAGEAAGKGEPKSGTILHRFPGEEGTEAVVSKHDKGYAVALRDVDAGETAQGIRIFPTEEAAVKHAQTVNPPKQPAAPPKPATDLFGAAIKPAAPKPEPIESLGGKQQGLFPKKGLPGQQNLFADRGVPADMVQKPNKPQAPAEQPAEPPKGDTPWTGGEIAKGRVYNIPTKDLHVDPERFQFKIHVDKAGVTDELKSVRKWNPDFAGVLAVWRDPENGKTFVVNGHHRAELANRLEVPDLPIRYIEAETAKEARGKGALINMAEGRGTAVDAAKYMRDAGATPEDLAKEGISLKGKVAGDATVLCNLSDRAFTNVVRETLSADKAVAVAKHLKSHELQDQLFRLLEKREDAGKDLSMRVIEEMAREMAATPTTTTTEKTLFGDIESEESLFVPRNELKSHVRADLSREVRDFLAVASKRRASAVSGSGNVLNVDENKRIADESSRVLGIYDTLVNRKGPIADAINEGAADYAQAKTKGNRDAVRKRTIESVRKAVFTESGIEGDQAGSVAMGQRRGTDATRRPAGVTRPVAANTRRRNPKPSGLIRSLAAVDPDFVAGYE